MQGVVLSHHNLESQASSLITAWNWSPEDRILHVLPLHHTHGIGKFFTASLYSTGIKRKKYILIDCICSELPAVSPNCWSQCAHAAQDGSRSCMEFAPH
jgi:long-subunit acyl-CoA synthetase (AMP-forming)